jgi:hypothetical protein
MSAFAHCDSMDGPVVKAAQKAVEEANPNPVLIWVQEKDAAEVREALNSTLAVRTQSPEARALADRFFFETVVRLHRAGEGAPFTGLKPAGRDIGPAVPAADQALEKGSTERLIRLLDDAVRAGVERYFVHALATKNFSADDIRAGREHVKAYVESIHYVEGVFEAAERPAHGHFPETAPQPPLEPAR